MLDEFPRKAFLTATEVRRLLRIENHKEWAAFLADNPEFPKMMHVGKKSKGKQRLRYSKYQVYWWIEANCTPEAG